ncbi:MAG: hypothetical protein AB7I38_09525 [Dehalococcoidia bacterium]
MSKLRDRLRETTRRQANGFGFTAARSTDRAVRQVLLVAEVRDAAGAAAAVSAGADVLLHAGADESFGEVVSAAGGRVVGRRVDAATAADTKAAQEAGAHFLAFNDRDTEAAALLDHRMGYVALLGQEDEAELRLLRPLDLDGAVVDAPGAQLRVRDQLRLRRTADLLRKPLFVRLTGAVDATTLEVWRDAGVAAVVVSDPSLLAEVAEAADAVPRPRESGERREVMVPAVQVPADEDDED